MKRHEKVFLFMLLFTKFVFLGNGQIPKQQTLTKYCGNAPKQQIIKKMQDYKPNPQIQSQIQKFFPADRQKFSKAITTGQSNFIQQSLKGHEGMYVVSIGIICLFALLMIIMIPLCFFTKCCSKCINQNQNANNQYKPCQICCPGAILILLIIALIVICGIILKINQDFKPKQSDIKCSLVMMTDYLLQGGTYQKNQQNIDFIGLNTLLSSFSNLNEDLPLMTSNIKSNISSKSKPMNQSFQKIKVLINQSSKLANENGEQMSLQYATPFLGTISNGSVNSSFPLILGTETIQKTLIYNMTNSLKQTNKTLSQISQMADNFNKIATQINITSALTTVNEQTQKVGQLEFNIRNTVDNVDEGIIKIYGIASTVILALTIFMSLCLCFSTSCLVFWFENSCNSKICFCCAVLWVVGLVHFALAIGITLVNPLLLYGCQSARIGFSSQNQFQNNFGDIYPNDLVAMMFKNCLASSQEPNYVFDQIFNSTNSTELLQNLTLLSESFQKYPKLYPNAESIHLLQNYSNVLSTIQKYRVSQILDISGEQRLQQLKEVSKQNLCMGDSWIPSLKSNTISCVSISPTTPSADNITCPDEINFQNRSQGCIGCIDTFLILQRYNTKMQILNSLEKRYQNCTDSGKQQFVQDVSNLWERFYFVKKDKIGQVKNNTDKMYQNLTILCSNITSTISPIYQYIMTKINQNKILNNNETLKQKMDCRVLGFSVNNAINVSCSSMIPFAYQLRFLYSASAVLLLFICLLSIFIRERMRKHKINKKLLEKQRSEQLRNLPTTQRKQTMQELDKENQAYF